MTEDAFMWVRIVYHRNMTSVGWNRMGFNSRLIINQWRAEHSTIQIKVTLAVNSMKKERKKNE